MTKRDFVVQIALKTGLIQKDVYDVVQMLLDGIVESLEDGENVEFRNFGVFQVRQSKRRIGRNPANPEYEVTIPSRRIVKFKMGRVMTEKVSGSEPCRKIN